MTCITEGSAIFINEEADNLKAYYGHTRDLIKWRGQGDVRFKLWAEVIKMEGECKQECRGQVKVYQLSAGEQ